MIYLFFFVPSQIWKHKTKRAFSIIMIIIKRVPDVVTFSFFLLIDVLSFYFILSGVVQHCVDVEEKSQNFVLLIYIYIYYINKIMFLYLTTEEKWMCSSMNGWQTSGSNFLTMVEYQNVIIEINLLILFWKNNNNYLIIPVYTYLLLSMGDCSRFFHLKTHNTYPLPFFLIVCYYQPIWIAKRSISGKLEKLFFVRSIS